MLELERGPFFFFFFFFFLLGYRAGGLVFFYYLSLFCFRLCFFFSWRVCFACMSLRCIFCTTKGKDLERQRESRETEVGAEFQGDRGGSRVSRRQRRCRLRTKKKRGEERQKKRKSLVLLLRKLGFVRPAPTSRASLLLLPPSPRQRPLRRPRQPPWRRRRGSRRALRG